MIDVLLIDKEHYYKGKAVRIIQHSAKTGRAEIIYAERYRIDCAGFWVDESELTLKDLPVTM